MSYIALCLWRMRIHLLLRRRIFPRNLFERFWTLNIVADKIGKNVAGDRFSFNVLGSVTALALPSIYSLWTWHGSNCKEIRDSSLIMFMYLRQKVITAFSFLHKNIWQMVVWDFQALGFLFKSVILAYLYPKLWFSIFWHHRFNLQLERKHLIY